MKQFIQFLAGSFLLLGAFSAQAQSDTGAAYFAGKWNIVVKGTPGGDSKMYLVFEKGDSTMTGTVQDSTGKEIAKLDKTVVSGTTATVYFYAQGYDVNLVINKQDQDHITGSLLGMFQAEGERVKVIK